MSGIAVSVVVPTLGRPRSLERALRSVLAQTRTADVELVVVDNDPAGSARALVTELAAAAPLPVRYVAEPSPGVSNARNAGVAAAAGPLIAFLDDDQGAPPQWLEALIASHAQHGADATFGPVRADLPPSARRDRPFLQRFFSRERSGPSGPIPDYYGCGNCLIARAALPDPAAPFSAKRNTSGGEDDLLFAAMQAAGARFVWAADAWVHEHVPEARATSAYVLRRAFVYGQGPSSACAAAGPRRWPMVPVWMGIGAGQALAYGALALVRRDRAAMLDRAAQGLGKVFWFFKLGLYGRVPAPSTASAA